MGLHCPETSSSLLETAATEDQEQLFEALDALVTDPRMQILNGAAFRVSTGTIKA